MMFKTDKHRKDFEAIKEILEYWKTRYIKEENYDERNKLLKQMQELYSANEELMTEYNYDLTLQLEESSESNKESTTRKWLIDDAFGI